MPSDIARLKGGVVQPAVPDPPRWRGTERYNAPPSPVGWRTGVKGSNPKPGPLSHLLDITSPLSSRGRTKKGADPGSLVKIVDLSRHRAGNRLPGSGFCPSRDEGTGFHWICLRFGCLRLSQSVPAEPGSAVFYSGITLCRKTVDRQSDAIEAPQRRRAAGSRGDPSSSSQSQGRNRRRQGALSHLGRTPNVSTRLQGCWKIGHKPIWLSKAKRQGVGTAATASCATRKRPLRGRKARVVLRAGYPLWTQAKSSTFMLAYSR